MMDKQVEYIEVVPNIEAEGFKVKALYAANCRLPYDFDKKIYQIIEKNGNKFMMVKCDYLMAEIE